MLKPSLDNMNTIKKCFEIILTGNRDESCLAARRVRKLVYSPEAKEKYEEAIGLKVADYIYKPFDMSDFLRTVKKTIS